MSSDVLRRKIHDDAPKHAPSDANLEIHRLGRGVLTGRRFTVDLYSSGQDSLVADALQDPAGKVWGVAYRLNEELVVREDGRRSVLDRTEGYRTESGNDNYEPIEIRVQMSDANLEAFTYVGIDDARERRRLEHPHAVVKDSYAQTVINGAHEANLPDDYFAFLRRELERDT